MCELLEEIEFELNDAIIEECPNISQPSSNSNFNSICPDKKIIKFSGKFILPSLPLNNIR